MQRMQVGVVDMSELWVMMVVAAAIADGALFWHAARRDKRDRAARLSMNSGHLTDNQSSFL
jgi:hypothetical protein